MKTNKSKIPGIYKITHVETGKTYIGQSNNIPRRWIEHRGRLKAKTHENEHLQNIYNKHGKASLHFSVLECSSENLCQKESFHIGQIEEHLRLNTGAVQDHWNISDELRKKMSESAKKRGISVETRKKISESLKGKPSWNKGLKTGKQSEELIAKRVKSRVGFKHSEETKIKMSKAMTGVKKTKRS